MKRPSYSRKIPLLQPQACDDEFVAAANKCSSLPYDSDISMSVAHAAMLDCERASVLASRRVR
jgi:hypothetical protein